jgi:hypothetical protein
VIKTCYNVKMKKVSHCDEWGNLALKKDSAMEEVLYDADEDCDHIVDPNNWSGIKCLNCTGWFCY